MARIRTGDKLDRIVDAAGSLFMRRGYRGTQIGDVAERARVSQGTVYLYVRDKASLFDLTIRRALHDQGVETVSLPYGAPRPDRLVDDSWTLVWSRAEPLLAHPAFHRGATENAAEEFEDLVRTLYRWIFDHWRGLKIIERCARDWPELAALFYKQFRRRGLALIATYLDRRTGQGCLRPMPDNETAARVILENCAFFAMHRHTAPDSEMIEGDVAEETVVRVLVSAFVLEP